ncbi:MAG: TonB family protein [Polyangiaceae bacterium]
MNSTTLPCTWISSRADGRKGPWFASVLVHVALLGWGFGKSFDRAAQRSETPIQVEVEVSNEAPVEPSTNTAAAPVVAARVARAPSKPRAVPTRVASVASETTEPSSEPAVITQAVPEPAPNSPRPPALPRFSMGASASPAPSGSDVFSEASVDVPARLRQTAKIRYPEAARRAEAEGDVVAELLVDSEGRVVKATALSALGFGFEEAALSAARRYRFSPAQKLGRRVSVRMRCRVRFRLAEFASDPT